MECPSNTHLYIVLDFEANCSARDARDHEVIEFPAQMVSASGEVLGTFREFVKPTRNPTISEFIHKLTGIAQDDVDKAGTFLEVLARFLDWVDKLSAGRPTTIVTCGGWDLRTMMPQQCQISGIEIPTLFRSWINIKEEFAKHCYRPKRGNPLGMAGMIHAAGMEIEGRHHSGIDDVKNITRILQHMIGLGKFTEPVVSTL